MLGSTGLCRSAGFMCMKRVLRVTGSESCRKNCVAVEWALSQCQEHFVNTLCTRDGGENWKAKRFVYSAP